MLKLYFISCTIGDESLDMFVRAPNEMEAYGAWWDYWHAKGLIPADTTPNYDLYRVPVSGPAGVIEWAENTAPQPEKVELVSASWQEPATDTAPAA